MSREETIRFGKKDTQAVKGIAIIMMVFHHCFLDPERYIGQNIVFDPFEESFINSAALSMKICVAVFTFLSAYGITMTYLRNKPDLDVDSGIICKSIKKRLISLVGNFLIIFILLNIYDIAVIGDGRFVQIYGEMGALSVLRFVIDGLGLAELFSFPTYIPTFWYMSLAIIVVLLIPLFILLYKRLGAIAIVGLSVLFSVLFVVNNDHHYVYLPHYIVCISMGIICADKKWIEKCVECRFARTKVASAFLFLALSLAFLMVLYLRYKTRNTELLPVMNGIISIPLCALTMGWINRVPGLSHILQYLGKHSMNIFLIHNFIRIVWYYDFTYSFKYWWLITLILLLISLAVSVVIELLKKIVHFNEFLNRLAA